MVLQLSLPRSYFYVLKVILSAELVGRLDEIESQNPQKRKEKEKKTEKSTF